MRTTRPQPHQRGVTLIELMVTVAVLVILLAVGVPSFSTLMANSRVTTAVNSFIADLQLARSEAIKRGEQVRLCIADAPPGAGEGCEDACDADGAHRWHLGYLICHGDETLRVIAGNLSPAVTISSGNRDVIVFAADGSSTGTNDTWTFCDVGGNASPPGRKVVVSNPGRARVEEAVAADCP
jgi:type IV fimbrial biogenesis protein FimT